MSMQKTARSRSSDNAQEALRQRKQVWNEACSEFIARLNAFKPHLISFKRGLNGRGDPKAGLPIANIKDPLPREISSFLGITSSEFNELASTFSTLVGEANGIISEQANYSAHRRKPRPKANNIIPHVAEHQLNDAIVVEASNSLSRFWANFSSWFSSDQNKSKRLSMLSLAHKLFKGLVRLEDQILEKGTENVPQVLTSFLLVDNDFKALDLFAKNMFPEVDKQPPENMRTDESLKSNELLESNTLDKLSPPTAPTKKTKLNLEKWKYSVNIPYERMKENALAMKKAGIENENIERVVDLYTKLINEKREDKIESIQDRMHFVYRSLISYIESLNKKSDSISTIEFEKFAAGDLFKFLKKYRHQIGSKDTSSATRMEAYNLIRSSKKQVDSIMDLLENKNIDYKDLKIRIKELDQTIKSLQQPIRFLNILHKSSYYESDKNTKNPAIVNPVSRYFTRKIRQDVDKPGW